jgi:hypothetical protein
MGPEHVIASDGVRHVVAARPKHNWRLRDGPPILRGILQRGQNAHRGPRTWTINPKAGISVDDGTRRRGCCGGCVCGG